MKNITHLFIGSMMVCAASLLFSCKKERIESAELQSTTPVQPANASQCRPAVFGAYDSYSGWTTIAQKWYVNGRVKYLKAKFGGAADIGMNPWLEGFNLNWGEVTYEGNQVYLKDVLNDKLVMRVTLDNQRRPVASYYYFKSQQDNYLNDTTYYYYNNGRLDYMISIFELAFYVPTPIFLYRKYTFSYDSYGNLLKAESPGSSRLNIQYDYTKPVKKLINNFQLTSSLKLLEYLELIELPMHHAVTRTNFETASFANSPYEYFSEVFYSEYSDYVISDGLVRSYLYDPGYRKVTLYNGWDCGTTMSTINPNAHENGISNLKQFQDVYRTR